MIELTKLSAPGWTKEFETLEEARVELYSHICGLCRKGTNIPVGVDGILNEYEIVEPPVDEHSDIGDLLYTACGCEYMIEDEE